MQPGLDFRKIAERIVSWMPGLRLIDTFRESGEFRLAGLLPERTMLVRHDPFTIEGWYCLATLEEVDSGRAVPQPRSSPLLAPSCEALYAIGLGWLVPESEWPPGRQEFKVTPRQIQILLAPGKVLRCPLKLARPLPEELRGYYSMPEVKQGVTTGEPWVLEQVRAWVAMGWRVRGL